jgi:hypothetical protein
MMHAGLVGVLHYILTNVGIPEMVVVTEARGLRFIDATRHGDVVVLDFFAEGGHLVIDAVVTTVYRNTIVRGVASIPGYAAKQAEEISSVEPIAAVHGGSHVLVPLPLRTAYGWVLTHLHYLKPWRR